jgi:hypothetical protein
MTLSSAYLPTEACELGVRLATAEATRRATESGLTCRMGAAVIDGVGITVPYELRDGTDPVLAGIGNLQWSLRWVSTAGHSWLAVPRWSVRDLDISNCSYDGGNVVYLEGDCDAAVWVDAHDAYDALAGIHVEEVDDEHGPARGCPPWRGEVAA